MQTVAIGLIVLAFSSAPRERMPTSARPPQVAQVTLARTVCFGTCPAYSVTLSADGAVLFVGEQFVCEAGEHRAKVRREDVQNLLAEIEAQGFWNLKDEYRLEVTDSPTSSVTLKLNGREKTVIAYPSSYGPPALEKIQERIDEVANTRRWLYRKNAQGKEERCKEPLPANK